MKNIIICSDGTGNTAIKGRGTNVFKLFEAVELRDPNIQQIAIYDDGVGTENNKLLKIFGGAFGAGLSRNVKQLYTELVRVYEPGDQIYLFGFSRGAFTVRVLAGFIEACGILKNDTHYSLKKSVQQGYRQYRRKFRRFQWFRKKGRAMQDRFKNMMASDQNSAGSSYAAALDRHMDKVKDACYQWREAQEGYEPPAIRFIGVWDTVAAVGLPSDDLANLLNEVFPFKMQDQRLGKKVVQGCHALAIDDERRTFHPLMWDEREEQDEERIKQVWFAGAHSNVGGGYTRQGMSLVALDWMMDEAEQAGLVFKDSARKEYKAAQNVHDKLYDSRAGLAVYYRYKPRNIVEICQEFGVEPKVHSSVLERASIATEGYAPGNLPNRFEHLDSERQQISPFNLALGDGLTSLLDQVKGRNFMRRYVHHGFLLSTLLLLFGYVGFGGESDALDRLKSLTSMQGLMDAVFSWDFGLIFLGLLVVFYALGWVLRRQLKKIYSHGLRAAFQALETG